MAGWYVRRGSRSSESGRRTAMGIVAEKWAQVDKKEIRGILMQVITLGTIVAHSLMIWQGLVLATGTKSPIVVVLSASMEPAFKRGDIVFLHNPNSPIRNGEIVVYQLDGREIPIIHRVIRVHQRDSTGKEVLLLTKGDGNEVSDEGLYGEALPGLMWLGREHILGRAVGFVPSIGWATLLMQDYPVVKYTLLPGLALLLLALGSFDG